MDEFVEDKLAQCSCGDYIDIFKENVIDEATFRKLTLDDLREILPGKVGIQKKIFEVIENLKSPVTCPAGVLEQQQSSTSMKIQTEKTKSDTARPLEQGQKTPVEPAGSDLIVSATSKGNFEPEEHDDLAHIRSLLKNAHPSKAAENVLDPSAVEPPKKSGLCQSIQIETKRKGKEPEVETRDVTFSKGPEAGNVPGNPRGAAGPLEFDSMMQIMAQLHIKTAPARTENKLPVGHPVKAGTLYLGPSVPVGPSGPPRYSVPVGPSGPPRYSVPVGPSGPPRYSVPVGPSGPPRYSVPVGPSGPPRYSVPVRRSVPPGPSVPVEPFVSPEPSVVAGPMNPPRSYTTERILKRRQKLPIFKKKDEFIQAMRNHQVLIVVGETGSGKSTQLPQFLAEEGFGTLGKIGCTQPRRVAAKALAHRVAEEAGSQVGERVGYRIRFDNRTANNTTVIYMTDGILLQEFASEPFIDSYACIMLDEAHERSMNTDILIGLLIIALRERPELKVIVTSATLDTQKFSKYFDNAPVFEIKGRTFPVEKVYTGQPEPDYVNACVSTVMRIHRFEKEGDILVFLGGQDEIERCCDLVLTHDDKQELWVLPCYGSQSLEEQNRVFDPIPKGCTRKVVVATNIAETSITIDGIVFVIDSGMVKQSEFDPRKKLTTLTSMRITQAQAEQRAGRAGRTRPGKCFRLYSELTFKKMPKAPVPEIQRSNLESAVLLLAAQGVEDLSRFQFMDPPPPEALASSIIELQDLEALDSQGRLTSLGRQISRFPLEPKLSKVLIMSVNLQCTEDILTIASIFSVQQSGKLFLRPKKQRVPADQARASFFKPEGDHHTYLNAFQQTEAQNYSKEWCRKNYINLKTLDEVLAIREQLEKVMESNALKVNPGFLRLPDPQAVQKCLLSAYFSQIAYKTPRGHGYMTYANPNDKELVFIHPSSALFKSTPNWVIYEEVMNTGKKAFLMNVVAVEPRWIKEFAPVFFEKLERVFPQLRYAF